MKSAGPGRGRPRSDQAGQVEQRLLDAANELFLRQGYERTTFDQVAEAASASKTTVYARYPTKADLFAAVVRRDAAALAGRMNVQNRPGSTRQRLITAGRQLAEITLGADSIALMRVTSAEAEQFPDLAREGFRVGFGECARCIDVALSPDGGTDAPAGGTAPREVTVTARRFVELALHPLYFQAFFGADLVELRRRAPADIELAADVVLAGLTDGA